MAGAFKSSSGREEQESAVASRPDRVDPHSGGSTFSEEFFPHCPLDQVEGGDEFPSGDMGVYSATDPDISPFPDQAPGAAASPARVPPATSPSEGDKLHTDELATDKLANLNEGQSPTSSVLLPHSGTIIPSPTTGRLTQVDTHASSPELSTADDDEPLDYGSSSHHEDADEDESDDDNFYAWADQPPPPSDKASGYLPFYPTGSPTTEAAGTSSSLPSQATDAPPSESMPVTTSSLPEEPLSLTIPLKPVGTEIVLSSTQTGVLMALPSSPSQLDITIASPTSSRSSPIASASGSMLLSSPPSSPVKTLSPVALPSILKVLIRPLEDMMKIAIEEISAGRATFDSFKPLLTHSLNGIRYLDDARLFQHCSEGVSRLEKDLRALEELHRADLIPRGHH
ncbi:mucin-7-like [Asparagus officinalis]|uniref:mucin-7-like n=1 Tax=Asparagus officinalis TaxID=4686 RepID=UPI00098E7D3D|nr:mucin-7-like [Asparagus officinalis]